MHVAEVDIDANQKMADDFDIEAVPTLILLTADGKIVSRQTGFMEAGDLMRGFRPDEAMPQPANGKAPRPVRR